MNQASVATLDTAVDEQPVAAAQDQRLVSATRAGDDRAFGELYERYRPRIRAFALRMTRDPDRAEDLVQDVFISALRRLRATDSPIVFRPWIYEIARNACIDEHRRRSRITEVPIDRDRTESWLAHLAGGPSPEVAMQSKQQLEDLCGAFRGLSERHHRIIVARELEGKSYRQIGDELEMSQVVVESTLFRARRRLTEEFQELSTGRRCERVRAILTRAPGRRLGIRERRAVATHIERCRSCRRQALAAGFSLKSRPARPLQKAAAALFPAPLLRLPGRTAAAAHQRAEASASATARFGQALGSLGPGRIATALAAVVAGVGGGLLSQPGQGPAQAGSRHAAAPVRTVIHSGTREHGVTSRSPIAARSAQPPKSSTGARRTTTRPTSRASIQTTVPRRAASGRSGLSSVAEAAQPIQAPAGAAAAAAQRTVDSITAVLGKARAPVKPPVNLPAATPSVGGLLRSAGHALPTPSVPSLPAPAGGTVPGRSPAVP